MSDKLIEKILNDLALIPATLNFQISPFKVNEPFLDNRLFDIIRSINDNLPNAKIALTSNSVPITEKKLQELITLKNIAYLWLSVNEYRPVEYEKIMQLPWENTKNRLDMIHQYKASREIPFDIVLSRVGDKTEADNDFSGWVKTTYPYFRCEIFQRGGWIGQVDIGSDFKVPDIGCIRWFDISITATGVVAHCCMDGKAEWPIGDVNTESVLEIYNKPAYKKLRESTISRKDAVPCNQCSFL